MAKHGNYRRDEARVNISEAAFDPTEVGQAYAEYGAAHYEEVAQLMDNDVSNAALSAAYRASDAAWDRYELSVGGFGEREVW